MATQSQVPFRFLELPQEIRDDIYALSFKDEYEPFKLRKADTVSESNGLKHHEVSMAHCLRPEMLLVNKQTMREYQKTAYRSMRLVMLFSMASDKGPFRLPPLASYTSLPEHVLNSIQSLEVHLIYGVFSPDFPQIHGLDQWLTNLSKLRRLNVEVVLMVELLEDYCPPHIRIPTVRELFVNFPPPSGIMLKTTAKLGIISRLFEQNPNYIWKDINEAKIIGNMWLHVRNSSLFRAIPGSGPYTWRGLELTYRGTSASFEELYEDCAKNTIPSGSPYIT